MVVFGLTLGSMILLAFRIPRFTVSVVSILIATFVVLEGVIALTEAARARPRPLWLVLHAVAGFVAGGLLLMLEPRWAVRIFGAWAIVTGLLDVTGSSQTGKVRILAAVLWLALGLLIAVDAFVDPARALLSVSIYGVVVGGMQLYAVRVRYTSQARARLR